MLEMPDRLAVDPVHNEIFVPEVDKVLVYPRGANGNVAPIRVLEGPDTMLGADAVAVDPVHDLLIVGGGGGRDGTRLKIFNRTDAGNTKPKRVIGGPKSMLTRISGPFTVYPPTGRIIVTVRERRGESENLATDTCFVGVWNRKDNGDVPPKWNIGGPKGVLQMVRGVAVNPKHKELIVTDKRLNAILTFYFPELF